MKTLIAILLLLVFMSSCTRKEEATREFEGPTESFELRKTGTSVTAAIDVKDPLVLEGRFICYETEIIGEGPEAGMFTPEIEGGKVRHKDSQDFRAVIGYLIEAGGESFSGTESLTIGGTSALTLIHITSTAESDLSQPGGPINFLHVPRGLTGCKLSIHRG